MTNRSKANVSGVRRFRRQNGSRIVTRNGPNGILHLLDLIKESRSHIFNARTILNRIEKVRKPLRFSNNNIKFNFKMILVRPTKSDDLCMEQSQILVELRSHIRDARA